MGLFSERNLDLLSLMQEEDKEHLNEAEARAAAGELGIQDDIKEICDVSSGMASSVMQLFLKQVRANEKGYVVNLKMRRSIIRSW